jgi:hypothetical protein
VAVKAAIILDNRVIQRGLPISELHFSFPLEAADPARPPRSVQDHHRGLLTRGECRISQFNGSVMSRTFFYVEEWSISALTGVIQLFEVSKRWRKKALKASILRTATVFIVGKCLN